MSIVELDKVSISIGRKILLKDVSFSISEGVLGIVGINGIGKTTLLKTLAGLNSNYTGQIKIDNLPLMCYGRGELSKLVSLVFQESVPYFNFTVKEMILFGRTPYLGLFTLPSNKDHEIVEKVITDLGIEYIANRYYQDLSGGEKRLTSIATSLAQETPIILMDEPTTSLDIRNTVLILRKIKQLILNYNKLIILTIHDINQLLDVADKTLFLYSPDKSEFGDTNDIVNKENLRKIFGIDFQVIQTESVKFVLPNSI